MPILPEPNWGTSIPTKSYDRQSALRLIRPTPSVVSGVLIQLVRAHFSDPDNIVDTQLKDYIWVKDNLEGHTIESKIQIDSSYKFKPETVQQRPSILVSRGSLQNQEFLITNGPGAYMSPVSGNYEGDDKYTVLVGEHSIECCGKTEPEADRLSEEVFFRMLEYKSVIKCDLNFSEFDVTLLNGPEKIDENHEHWKSVVGIKWKFVYGWTLAPLAPVLKQIDKTFDVF